MKRDLVVPSRLCRARLSPGRYGPAAKRSAHGAAVAVLSVVAIVLAAALGFTILSYQSAGHNATTVTRTTTVTSTALSSQSLAYLSYAGGCEAGGEAVPCWGNSPYLFNCLGEAETPQGCTRLVVTTSPGSNFSVNVKYPSMNKTQPSWANCSWSVPGVAGQQGYGYCTLVNATSFTVGKPAPPRQ